MLFNSIDFLIFLPIVFILYWICPKKLKWIVLLLASYFFYMYWNWKLVFLILFTTIVSYICGVLLDIFNKNIKVKKLIIIVSLVLCFGVLIMFKYFAFFVDVYFDIISLFRKPVTRGHFEIMLPVGISFYTFQTVSYIIDVYRGTVKAERHFGYFALFVSFFPQLVAGPIERTQDLLPQLKNAEKSINKVDYTGALRIMLVGFFKKIAVADIIGIYVNYVYQDIASATGLSVLIASLLFAIQIFCDFSGYSDIAVGCAKLLGVELTENFNHPYGAKSIKEFWGRWHISLSRWLRDYIYIPLGGNRCPKWKWVFNVLFVFFISGLWHGANYTFLVWGVLHGIFQIIGVFTIEPRNKMWNKLHVNPKGKMMCVLRMIFTFLLVDFCWIFFRANNINDAAIAITKIFSNWSFESEYFNVSFSNLGITIQAAVYILICCLILFFIEKLKNLHLSPSKIFNCSWIRYTFYLLLFWMISCSWLYLQASEVGSSFIYFQF